MSSQTATPSFTHSTAFRKLQQLAKHPFDLTQPDHLTPERLLSYASKASDYTLYYGTERVDEHTLISLEALAQETKALEKMHAMQNGAIVNTIIGYPSENRPALHTALRDIFDNRLRADAARKASDLALQEVDKLKSFLATIEEKSPFDTMVVIGIGGSDLGPRATYNALRYLQKSNKQVHFISNVDPDDAAEVMSTVNLSTCLVTVISKSGTTLETTTNEELVKSVFFKAGLDPKKHFIAITMPHTPMDTPQKYLQTFYIWDWVGGRYSTSSMVGGVVLGFAYGMDVFLDFLKGAHEMDVAARQPSLKNNLSLLAALLGIWNRNFLRFPTLAVIPYSQPLSRYPAHFQQVDMESNGKRITQEGIPADFDTGTIIWGEPGTNAQHSFFQLIHQGTTIVPVEFIGYKENCRSLDMTYEGTTSREKLLANLFAQMIGLATGQPSDNPNRVFPGNRPSHLLLAKKLTPHSLGSLLAFYENKVDFQGFIWGINSFDQEGVQLGKHLANEIISSFADTQAGKRTNSIWGAAIQAAIKGI